VIPAAVWLRVSTDDQETDNQVPDIERFLAHHGYTEARRFVVDDSAFKDDTGGPEYRAKLQAALDGAWRGQYRVIVVWALDRITRLGAEAALRLVRQFRERGVTLLSVQESWLNSSPEITDVLVAFAGWTAQQESKRRSGRIRAGIARRKAQGGHVGRKSGARDAKPRRTAGYAGNTNARRAA
jgi:DNA invertase Pin-like site-specific DNA recombinase